MDDDQQFCLRWNNHQSTLISVFDTLLENGTLVDCTLAAEGKFLKAHKVVLSACSPYFATLLSEQYDKHPIFILKDVKYQELRAMMDYMYRGEVNISQDQLAALLKAAESLQIKGLSDNRAGSSGSQKPTAAEHKNLSVPGKMSGAGGYTLEQTKRARLGPSSVESQELSGSREGSSSPTSRKRRKVRRRSVENVMADNHDNSNSSQSMQINSSAGTLSNATGAITSVATIVATGVPSSSIPITTSGSASTIAANVTKKTESVSKLVNTDVISTDNEQDDELNEKIIHHGQVRKEQNHHKRASKMIASGNMGDVCKDGSEIAIEPKSEYDDGNDETVEDLTLDDEDIGLEDLDQTAGPSHGGEGSSQGYAQWQVDRSHDEVYMATQEAQQRDPQDLSTKLNKSLAVTSNIVPVIKQPNSKKQATVTPAVAAATQIRSNGKKRLSMSDVSDMLLEFYKANTAKAPKNENLEKHVRQSSPSSADGAAPPPITPIPNGDDVSQSKIPNEPTTITTNIDTASKNLNGDETAIDESHSKKNNNMPFHPRIKYSSVKNKNTTLPMLAKPTAIVENAANTDTDTDKHQTPAQILTSIIPTGILSSTPSSVIKPPVITNPAALAAAIFRDGYHTFQQQLRAHEFIKQSIAPCESSQKVSDNVATHQHIQDNAQLVNVQHYLSKENRSSEYDEGSDDYDSGDGEDDDDDDDEDGRYPAFDDIHLIEGSKLNYASQMNLSSGAEYLSDESSQKYNMMAAQALRNLEFSLNDFGGNPGEEPLYQCRHCGKKYRWKSTLRRHENVECGGKEPSHQCPYCPYKSKQRGNLGVHVRKHHSNLPQLASKRRSKYSQGGNDLSNGSVKDEKE